MLCSNIDRCFANTQWLSEFSNVVVERLEKGVSDHCPQLLRFDTNETKRGLFKLYNVLTEHDQFEQITKEGWGTHRSQNKLRDIWMKCQSLKKLNSQWFLKTTKRVANIRQQLQLIQHSLLESNGRVDLIREEKSLLAELEKWSKIEEHIWHQKSRIDWLRLGDSNTKFFHAYAKVRQNTNVIHRLVKSDGTVCLGQEEIKQEITEFYRLLMGPAADELTMVDRGPKLNS